MKSRYLLDTNHLGAALNLDQRVWGRLRSLVAAGDRIATCVPVLCELEVGLRQTTRRDQNHRLLRKILHEVRVWNSDLVTVDLFADVYEELRGMGRVLSNVDITVCALARQMRAIVVTVDRDFEALPDLQRENWLV